MAASLFRCTVGLLPAFGVEGFRLAKTKAAREDPGTKFIAGVPVLNYDAAYEGEEVSMLGGELEGEWIFIMQPEASASQIQKLCQVARNGCNFEGRPEGVPFFEMRGTESDLEDVIAAADRGTIKFIEPDSSLTIPDLEIGNEAEEDEGPSSQRMPNRGGSWGLNKIGASLRFSSGSGTYVYVLDSGVRTSHREFANAQPELDTSGGGFKRCAGDLNCAADRNGHGTHCAGTIAGRNYGVAPNANVRGVKVFGDNGKTQWSYVISAMDYLSYSSTRPAVLSMSLGQPGKNRAYDAAVRQSTQAGLTVVVAAGNSNSDACNTSPAYAESAITVAATDESDRRSGFSNFGSCVDIFAPGSNVVSLSNKDDTQTATKSGTSMACPHVAGAALLVLQTNPSFNSVKVLAKLVGNAVRGRVTDVKGSPNILLSVSNL